MCRDRLTCGPASAGLDSPPPPARECDPPYLSSPINAGDDSFPHAHLLRRVSPPQPTKPTLRSPRAWTTLRLATASPAPYTTSSAPIPARLLPWMKHAHERSHYSLCPLA